MNKTKNNSKITRLVILLTLTKQEGVGASLKELSAEVLPHFPMVSRLQKLENLVSHTNSVSQILTQMVQAGEVVRADRGLYKLGPNA